MIKLYSFSNGTTTEITNLVKSIGNTGDKSQVARKLDITLAHSIWDTNQPNVQAPSGTKIWLVLDGSEIFRGIVWDRILSSSTEESTLTVYDYLIYFLKSKVTYNFTNITPEAATKKICAELGVTAGNLATTGIKMNRLIAQKSGYEAIMEMYTQASKINGKQYIPVMNGSALDVIEKGKTVANYTLRSQLDDSTNNVLDTRYEDTLDSMVNKVKIYDSKNAYAGQVSNDSWVKSYGIIQDNYKIEKGKNSNVVAKAILTGVLQTPTIQVLGNWSCRTGYAVNTEIFYVDTLKKAVGFIDGDTHTWEPATGKYTMSLNLNFKNLMDSQGG